MVTQDEKALFSERLNSALDAIGTPQKGKGRQVAVAKMFGVSQKGARKWLEAEAIPETKRLPEMAQRLHVTVEWLLTGSADAESAAPYSANSDSNISEGPSTRGLVPLISWVQAGDWQEATDHFAPGDAEEWLPCPQHHGPHTFALRVRGDSMTSPHPGQRSYPDGTIIYVDPDASPDPGRRVVVKLLDSNEVTFKTLQEDAGRKFLVPINPQYPNIEINGNAQIVGVVIGSYLPE